MTAIMQGNRRVDTGPRLPFAPSFIAEGCGSANTVRCARLESFVVLTLSSRV
jgi:hypothetical protein